MAAEFDGSTSYLLRNAQLAKISDSDAGTLLAWVYLDAGGDSSAQYIFSLAGDKLSLQRNAANKFVVTGKNAAGSTILLLTSSTSYTGGSTWYQVLATWDLSAGAGYLYINRADDEAGSPTLTNGTIDYTASPVAIGAKSDATGLFDGRLLEVVFWPGFYSNISTQSNLIKFISADGLTDSDYTPTANYPAPGPTASTPKPVSYGVRGVVPSDGIEAAVMFSGAFAKNGGNGGIFTLNGTIDQNDTMQTYRQSSTIQVPGQRSFDSEISGFTYPREQTFIERRDGLNTRGLRLGTSERDDTTRDEWPERRFDQIVFPDREEDTEERDR